MALSGPGTVPALAQELVSPAPNAAAEFQLGLPQSGILTIQPDRLFSESAFGKRVEREIEAEGAVLTAENRRIEAELRAEELELTERRSDMAPDAFRALADAFDQKVQETRRRQDQKLREINQMGEDARREFITASLPVLQQIMRETGAGAILDHASVFLSADAADITSLAIGRIDAVLGDGATVEESER
ncbi:outer membrane chaperone Skp [Leisingera methylohalidivorans DSM 14336]|uniref:Outer membrane chaperone Skp n=1 Tax=Leisingera methylohalidivorans DSM 14336 TaxID=999552 RepID=V9VVT6_9RHOB|nr:outer membrane chaperone Skp [Leisingera methylohalidivorans DSM 14336]